MALNILNRDFPGGPGLRFHAASGGGAGSIPGQGTKIPHAVEELNLHTTTRESVHHNEVSLATQ